MRRWVASAAGLGRVPRRLWGSDAGAGTFGAALAAVAGLGLLDAPAWVDAAAAVAVIAIAGWAAMPFADGDPGWVAIDEVAGTLVAFIGLSGVPWLVALIVSRVADISKALPGVKAAEGLGGAVGVVADDVVAGCYGLAAGWIIVWL
jgi:phosphatidylglycerophosphatase A